MNIKTILAHCDHTLLKQTATWDEIRGILDEAIEFGCASACIPPSYVEQAADYAAGRTKICTVIGFPNGYNTTESKIFETQNAVVCGADEIDMVANIGWIKSCIGQDAARCKGMRNLTIQERLECIPNPGYAIKLIEEIKAVRAICSNKILKVIIETCLLNDVEKIMMCDIVTLSGADYIKTSTGFSTGGATFDDVKLFSEYIDPKVKIKAAGGIASLEDAEKFLSLGANRLGTSRIVKLAKEK